MSVSIAHSGGLKMELENIRIEFSHEFVLLGKPARISIFQGGSQVASLVAEIKSEKGADGRPYPCVKFREQEFWTSTY